MNDRQARILGMLREERRITVKKLAATLYVSEMTIRRDLRQMEAEGLIRRYSGGAMYIGDDRMLPIDLRRYLNAGEKESI